MEINKQNLQKLYIEDHLTTTQIAKIIGYKSSTTVSNLLRKFDIQIRDKVCCQCPILIDPILLNKLYCIDNLSIREISCIIGNVSEETIRRSMVDLGILRKENTWKCAGWNVDDHLPKEQITKISNTRKEKFKSSEIVHWNIGRICPYDVREKISLTLLDGREAAQSNYGSDWRKQRTSCLQRDNYCCTSCGSEIKLHVHHWEPYRFSFDNSLDNLVTLCSECHTDIHVMYRRENFIKEAEEYMYA